MLTPLALKYPSTEKLSSMSEAHEAILDDILDNEGVHQWDVADKANFIGGVNVGTNKGITPATYKAYFGKVPTRADMGALTTKQAREIYQKQYIDPIVRNINPKPELLKQLADIHVHSGWGNMVAMLQRASGATVDGKSGPGLKAKMAENSAGLGDRLVDVRVEDFNRQVRSEPEKQRFINGWINRAEKYRAPSAVTTPPVVQPSAVSPVVGSQGRPV